MAMWRNLYDPALPHSLDSLLQHDNGLDMFLSNVRRFPDHPLIHYFGTTLTLKQVDRMSSALAHYLSKHASIKPGDCVAVYMQNVPAFIISLLAIWKLGAIQVNINPMLRTKELRYILQDSGARALITLETLYSTVCQQSDLSSTNIQVTITTSELDFAQVHPPEIFSSVSRIPSSCPDFIAIISNPYPSPLPSISLEPSSIAFLTYTSGTTGPPKGAMNSHGSVVYNATSFQTWMQLSSQNSDVILGIAPFFHITGLIGHVALSLLGPLPLVHTCRFHPVVVAQLAQQYKATFTVGAITAFIALLNESRVQKSHLGTLQKIWSGGAPISESTLDAFEKKFGTYIHNLYGLTETTAQSHGVPGGKRAPVDPVSKAVSVGVPMFDTLCKVVNEETGEEAKPREIGEIATSGPQVVDGYWKKEEESKKAIRPDAQGRKWLFTGDVGFRDEKGWFYIVDRKKDMIVASGYKIWPREVEDGLYEFAGVKECAVVGVADAYRGETVKAFVSLKDEWKNRNQEQVVQELMQHCKQNMAAYKYPRIIEVVDEIPKNLSGKILRRMLRNGEKKARL